MVCLSSLFLSSFQLIHKLCTEKVARLEGVVDYYGNALKIHAHGFESLYSDIDCLKRRIGSFETSSEHSLTTDAEGFGSIAHKACKADSIVRVKCE